MVLECLNSGDSNIWVVGREIGPMLFRRIVNRSGNNLKVFRMFVRDEKKAVAMMIDMIDQLFFPRLDQEKRVGGTICVNKPDFRSQFTFDLEKNELLAPRLGDRKLKTLVRFFQYGGV